MDEENDYMSASFLEPLEEPSELTYSKRRRKTLESQKKRGITKSTKVLEIEKREEALATHIPESNIGYQMLKKLGFKPGDSLGRKTVPSADSAVTVLPNPSLGEKGANVANSGFSRPLTEPIPIIVKTGTFIGHHCIKFSEIFCFNILDRLGLGIPQTADTSSSRKQSENEPDPKTEELIKKKAENFRTNRNEVFIEKQLLKDIHTARKVCEELDEKKDIGRSVLWLPERIDSSDEGVSEESILTEFDSAQPDYQLKTVLEYLRNTHFYCIYCGSVFYSEEDLSQNCPGVHRKDHDDF
ncbi:hypothetical protein HK098_007956 [Nowakowskiella sp. JEL0407]|nr:hypothetical protein HK098_007956 [Nowakowskiella sp. JEL0407]